MHNRMEDVIKHYDNYSQFINPVGQLIKIDPRVPGVQIIGRFCSGFNIDSEGQFLTAGHCLTQGDTCYALVDKYDTSSFRVSFNYHHGEELEHIYTINSVLNSGSCTYTWGNTVSFDYALLQLNRNASTQWGFLPPLINPLAKGSGVIAVSHPNGDPKKISFGNINNSDEKLIDHTAVISPGSSGSPLSGIVKDTAVAIGVNVRVSVDDSGKQDYKNHYALSMGTIAAQCPQVRRVSFLLDQQGLFQRARMPDTINLTEPLQDRSNNRNSNECCIK